MSREGFYGRRMVPEPLIKILQEMKEAGITKEDIQALGELTGLLENKQDKLTAGEGIAISEENVISATGGGGGVDPADDNTFTGANSFEGETTFTDTVNINSTAYIDEAEISTLYVDGENVGDYIPNEVKFIHHIEVDLETSGEDTLRVRFNVIDTNASNITVDANNWYTLFTNNKNNSVICINEWSSGTTAFAGFTLIDGNSTVLFDFKPDANGKIEVGTSYSPSTAFVSVSQTTEKYYN